MKKIEYSKPEMEVRPLSLESILGTISGNVDGNKEIGYGGDADDPSIDPAAKGFWDDEEDY